MPEKSRAEPRHDDWRAEQDARDAWLAEQGQKLNRFFTDMALVDQRAAAMRPSEREKFLALPFVVAAPAARAWSCARPVAARRTPAPRRAAHRPAARRTRTGSSSSTAGADPPQGEESDEPEPGTPGLTFERLRELTPELAPRRAPRACPRAPHPRRVSLD